MVRVLRWVGGYRRAWLLPDLTAGVLVVAIAVPLSMGMAEVAGVPPVVGLYTCVAPLVVYALIGPSRHLVLGLDASTAAIVAATVGPLAAGDPARYLALAGGLAVLAGGVLLTAGVLRIGRLASLLTEPTLVGYQAGLAVTVIVAQLHRVLAIPAAEPDTLPRLGEVLRGLGDAHLGSVVLGVLVGVAVVAGRAWRPALPAALLAVAAATAVVHGLGLDQHGIDVVGPVPDGLPSPGWPAITVDDARTLVGTALALALVVATDSVATSSAFARRNGYALDGDDELVALGAANVASGVTGGITVSASAARTAVAETAGSHTPLVSATAGLLLIVVLVFFTGVLATVPVAALAAVVITAVARLFEARTLLELARTRCVAAAEAAVVGLAVVVLGILAGVVLAVAVGIGERLVHRGDAPAGDAANGHGAARDEGPAEVGTGAPAAGASQREHSGVERPVPAAERGTRP